MDNREEIKEIENKLDTAGVPIVDNNGNLDNTSNNKTNPDKIDTNKPEQDNDVNKENKKEMTNQNTENKNNANETSIDENTIENNDDKNEEHNNNKGNSFSNSVNNVDKKIKEKGENDNKVIFGDDTEILTSVTVEESPTPKKSSRLRKVSSNLRQCSAVKSVLLVENPLPEQASTLDTFKWYCRCPPHGNLAWILTRCIGLMIALGALYGLLGPENAGPEIYLFVLYVTSRLSGALVSLVKLPPLLGMLLAGIAISNLNDIFDHMVEVDAYWKEVLRDVAFITILIRAGLSLNPKGVLQMQSVVARLAFIPGVITEGPTIALVAWLWLDMPLLWALMLGFILAAVSPAVVVPSLLGLQEKGFGVDQGVPTLIIAAASIDDIIAISAFSITLSINFADHGSGILVEILRAPLEVVLGVAAAFVMGIVLWFVPPPAKNEVDKKGLPLLEVQNHTAARFLLLFGSGIMFMFGARKLHLAGAGALGTLCVAFFTGLGWDAKTKVPVGEAFGHAWNSLMPLLFGLIGGEIDLKVVANNPDIILGSVGVILCGLISRVVSTFLSVGCAGLQFKERLFIAIAWIPKATVQAAMGSIPLELARDKLTQVKQHYHIEAGTERNQTGEIAEQLKEAEDFFQYGTIIITVAVLAILISAPIGAVGISLAGTKLLQPQQRQSRIDSVRRYSLRKRDSSTRITNVSENHDSNDKSVDKPESHC